MGVTTTADGVRVMDPFGRRRFVPWAEAQLFEVAATSRYLSTRSYCLYGAHGRATWQDNPGSRSEFAPNGVSASEMAERLQLLVNLIAVRTGLLPRTFSKALRPRVPQVR